MTELSDIAPAKINLTLAIVGRRDDGYHSLESRFGFADQGDIIAVSPAPETTLTVTGPFAAALDDAVAPGTDNIVMATATALRDHFNIRAGARIHLTKNLPVASGIGGGSADAAAALRVLSRLWGVDGEGEALADIALALGADVPACLAGVPQHVSGIGDITRPVAHPEHVAALLVNPGVSLSTPDVFAAYHAKGCRFAKARGPHTGPLSVSDMRERGNDLRAPAVALCPEIDAVIVALEACNRVRFAGMSGSGATCFALFEDSEGAQAAAAALKKQAPHYWVLPCQITY